MLAVALVLAQSLLGELGPVENPPPAPVVVEQAAKPAVVEIELTKSEVAAPVAAEAKSEAKAEETSEAKDAPAPRSVKITSERTDYDRKEGVIMFDRNVCVDDVEYKMHANQLYVFLDGTNDLKRIVAIGNVAITNETRVGTCAKAAYTKSTSKIVMYGDGASVMARLEDNGKNRSSVEGRKITFWIDSEQVEVEGSTVTLDAGKLGGKDGAKKLLGK
ncbi:MAG: LptA/OstA family protein [Kiritimatiellia bacterium]|nr:LptA/OstA family protein [Kiritimatiellia bacterium]